MAVKSELDEEFETRTRARREAEEARTAKKREKRKKRKGAHKNAKKTKKVTSLSFEKKPEITSYFSLLTSQNPQALARTKFVVMKIPSNITNAANCKRIFDILDKSAKTRSLNIGC